MAQISFKSDAYSTRATPLLAVILAVAGVVYLGACFLTQSLMPEEKSDLVVWVQPSLAIEKSKREHKPILYDFSADWCPPCRLLKKEVFGDKPLASEINKAFIPVQIIDRQREDGANSLETNRLQKRYKIKAFPTLVVSKIGMSDTKVQAGYKDKATVKLFIDDSLMWSYSASNSYEVKWHNLDDGIATSSESKRPLLILFWDERSITSRVDYLVNRKLANLIDQHFVPAEVELPIKPELFKTQQSKQLLAILDMKLSPALVIVPADGGTPHFQIGGTTADDNKEFLQKYLRFCEKKVNSSD